MEPGLKSRLIGCWAIMLVGYIFAYFRGITSIPKALFSTVVFLVYNLAIDGEGYLHTWFSFSLLI